MAHGCATIIQRSKQAWPSSTQLEDIGPQWNLPEGGMKSSGTSIREKDDARGRTLVDPDGMTLGGRVCNGSIIDRGGSLEGSPRSTSVCSREDILTNPLENFHPLYLLNAHPLPDWQLWYYLCFHKVWYGNRWGVFGSSLSFVSLIKTNTRKYCFTGVLFLPFLPYKKKQPSPLWDD